MTSHELNDIYFDWMQQLVCDFDYTVGRSYYKLLQVLHETEFYYSIPMDGNRAEDGVSLRYRFGYEQGIDSRIIAKNILWSIRMRVTATDAGSGRSWQTWVLMRWMTFTSTTMRLMIFSIAFLTGNTVVMVNRVSCIYQIAKRIYGTWIFGAR